MKSCSPIVLGCLPSVKTFCPVSCGNGNVGDCLNWDVKYLEIHPLAFPLLSKRWCSTGVGPLQRLWCEKNLHGLPQGVNCHVTNSFGAAWKLNHDDADWLTNIYNPRPSLGPIRVIIWWGSCAGGGYALILAIYLFEKGVRILLNNWQFRINAIVQLWASFTLDLELVTVTTVTSLNGKKITVIKPSDDFVKELYYLENRT